MHTVTIRVVELPNANPVRDLRVCIPTAGAKHLHARRVVRWLAEYAITMGLAFLTAYFILEVRW